MRILTIAILMVGMLLCAGICHSDSLEAVTYYNTPEGQKRVAARISCAMFDSTTSVPFAGLSTPPNILMGTHLTSPPEDYEAGRLYFFTDQWYMINMTPK